LLEKARKTAQSVKPSFDKRNAPQAMAISTGEWRRKADGREYNTPPPILCTPKELDVLCHLHNYVQHPTAECWALRRLVHRKIKEGTLELSQQEVKETHSQTTKGRV